MGEMFNWVWKVKQDCTDFAFFRSMAGLETKPIYLTDLMQNQNSFKLTVGKPKQYKSQQPIITKFTSSLAYEDSKQKQTT